MFPSPPAPGGAAPAAHDGHPGDHVPAHGGWHAALLPPCLLLPARPLPAPAAAPAAQLHAEGCGIIGVVRCTQGTPTLAQQRAMSLQNCILPVHPPALSIPVQRTSPPHTAPIWSISSTPSIALHPRCPPTSAPYGARASFPSPNTPLNPSTSKPKTSPLTPSTPPAPNTPRPRASP